MTADWTGCHWPTWTGTPRNPWVMADEHGKAWQGRRFASAQAAIKAAEASGLRLVRRDGSIYLREGN